jgi:hypothetical protein
VFLGRATGFFSLWQAARKLLYISLLQSQKYKHDVVIMRSARLGVEIKKGAALQTKKNTPAARGAAASKEKLVLSISLLAQNHQK